MCVCKKKKTKRNNSDCCACVLTFLSPCDVCDRPRLMRATSSQILFIFYSEIGIVVSRRRPASVFQNDSPKMLLFFFFCDFKVVCPTLTYYYYCSGKVRGSILSGSSSFATLQWKRYIRECWTRSRVKNRRSGGSGSGDLRERGPTAVWPQIRAAR